MYIKLKNVVSIWETEVQKRLSLFEGVEIGPWHFKEFGLAFLTEVSQNWYKPVLGMLGICWELQPITEFTQAVALLKNLFLLEA